MQLSTSELREQFEHALAGRGFAREDARASATLFAEATRDGVFSHGVNRFASYLRAVDNGRIDPAARPRVVMDAGAFVRMDGGLGPGNLNALRAMKEATDRAAAHGVGCVALANTNHWMRAGSYGWQAAEAGCVALCWTNTIGNLPPWGSTEPRLGNNPMVIAVPRSDGEHVVLDFAQSQYSYGKLSIHSKNGEPLPYPGGFDEAGTLTTDAAAIERTMRPLPVGMWKGAGISLLLDLTSSLLSLGRTTRELSLQEEEYGVSQLFLAIKPQPGPGTPEYDDRIEATIEDLHQSAVAPGSGEVRYPGERVIATRARHDKEGIPVDDAVWKEILELS